MGMIVRHISENLRPRDGARNLLGVWDMTLVKGEGLRPHERGR